MPIKLLILVSVFLTSVAGKCYEPSPAFPVPRWKHGASTLKPAFDRLETKLKAIISEARYDNSSYSVEVTSTTDTLWSSHHTARNFNESRPGAANVDGKSQYRIASNTKVFTVLAVLYQAHAGNLSLDSPVSDYIQELNSEEYEIPWKDISIRALASQLSGVPRSFAELDGYNSFPDAAALGLPDVPQKEIHVTCGEYGGFSKTCTRSDLLTALKYRHPVFAPNQKSTYGNMNYDILGLVIENVTGMPYGDYIQTAIFDPLNMTSSSLKKPTDEHAVLPIDYNWWDIEQGVQQAMGGIYSSSTDISQFLRYVLTHYNALTTGVNWLNPASFAEGMNTLYGTPWEIFRTDRILPHTRRPITFISKTGNFPGYTTTMLLTEDHGLGVTILTAGNPLLLDALLDPISVSLLPAAEDAIWHEISSTHAGTFTSAVSSSSSTMTNSSLTLAVSPSRGLHITALISNSTDAFTTLFTRLPSAVTDPEQRWYVQLVPMKLFKDEVHQKGEIWRFLIVAERPGVGREVGAWDEFCPTDVDQFMYGEVPINEVVFWLEEDVVELSAFRVKLKRERAGEMLAVQG